MWKVVVRGIRETLERRICRTNIYSQSSGNPNEDNLKNDTKRNLTCIRTCRPSFSIRCNDIKFCGSAKSTGTKDDNKRQSEWRASWPEAVGWSSILAAGWVVCQTICLHKGIHGRDSNKAVKAEIYSRHILSPILNQILNLHPRNILPITNCVGNDNKKSNLQDSNSQWTAEKPFGPITIEEAFKEAADEFTKTHKVVVGEYELHYGIKALEEKRYKDALMHFSAGAKLSSPGSMFNLGLCYELGIGTLVDQKKAAKYYNDAAAYDHADALYNLGVFHAQGRGGLPIDIGTARTYFTKAAKLGQEQAQRALDLEKAEAQSKKNIHSNARIMPNRENSKNNEANNTWNKLNDYILDTNFFTKRMHESLEHNEKIVDDTTHVFLDLLNFGNSSQTPIVVTTSRYGM